MTDTILWWLGWAGLGRHYGVIFEVSEDRGVPLAGFGAGGANRGTDTVFGERQRRSRHHEKKAFSSWRICYTFELLSR
ncbi:MAG: hypothetical protein GX456_09395 [Verrucomicrobia bacterium]|nr:hypothetical protein [Verrucomicrobiota bacterium]